MISRIAVSITTCILLAGCAKETVSIETPIVVTEDIQAGIEKHIEVMSKKDGGFFKVLYQNENLDLKLVRVHTEYLANLGPRSHFACVDLASIDGKVYDVDFFLAGDPGQMEVTETTVHKINGQPLYVWKQNNDKTWERVENDDATPELLGVLRGEDTFKFYYQVELPKITSNAKIWIPKPSNDPFQTVEIKSVDFPVDHQILLDEKYGNSVMFMSLGPEHSGADINITYAVQRLEKSVYEDLDTDPATFLKPDILVPQNEEFTQIATEVVEGKLGDLAKARALYDHTIDRMSYIKYGEGWGKGDAMYACDVKSGNCTDFHSYFIALARAVKIPARFAIGASIPSSRNEGGVDGYHCWAEFYANGKWWPVDISEGDKCSPLSTYYFGHHPANRLEFSMGRDLVVTPGPSSGPINFLAYPVLELDGKNVKAKVKFLFSREEKSNS